MWRDTIMRFYIRNCCKTIPTWYKNVFTLWIRRGRNSYVTVHTVIFVTLLRDHVILLWHNYRTASTDHLSTRHQTSAAAAAENDDVDGCCSRSCSCTCSSLVDLADCSRASSMDSKESIQQSKVLPNTKAIAVGLHIMCGKNRCRKLRQLTQ